MSRLSSIKRTDLTPAGQKVWDGIAGARGDVRGPYQILMQVPELAHVVGEVSRYLRFVGDFDHADLELAVLTTARTCGAGFVFDAHEPMARKAGTRSEAIEIARADAKPAGLTPHETVIIEVARALIREHRVDDALYARARAEFSEQQLVQLMTLVGYYNLVGMLLGGFDFTDLP